jgi:tetratricopeptide (TPR) repeat protein
MTVSRQQAAGRRNSNRLFFSILLTAHCSLLTYAVTLDEQAQSAWQDRDRLGQTEKAIRLWTEAVQADPNRADLWIRIAKAEGRAVRHANSSEERKKWADDARASADHAIRLDRQSAEAYTVYGEAMGQWAKAHKGIHSLSAVRQAIEALEKAIAIDPKHAYAHMLLAEFFRQSPRLFSVGDKKKALEHAQLAVQYGPAYAIDHLVLARAYLDLGKKDEGVAELQKVVTLMPPPDAVPETRADQETATVMLRSMGIAPIPAPCGEPGAGTCTEQKP